MQKRWWLLVISIWCCFPSSVSSFETVRVVVLPFEILAREIFPTFGMNSPESFKNIWNRRGRSLSNG